MDDVVVQGLQILAQNTPSLSPEAKERIRAVMMDEIKQLSRPRYQPQPATTQAVAALKAALTWRQMAEHLGYADSYAPTLRNVAAGQAGSLTPVTEAVLRQRLGLSKLPPKQEVEVCPSCLARGICDVHRVPDCHGLPIEEVVALAPGETVRKVRPVRSTPPAWKSVALRAGTTDRLRAAARAAGVPMSAFVGYLLTLHGLKEQGAR